MKDEKTGLENFNLDTQPQIAAEHIRARPGSVLVAVRGDNLEHLRRTLQKTNLRRHDIVVMTVRPLSTERGSSTLKKIKSSAVTSKSFLASGRIGRERRQARRVARSARRRSIRRNGANGGESQGLETGHGRFRTHGVR
jgi:hypothetical protein